MLDEEDLNDVFTPEVKKKILIAILVQILIGNMMVSNLVAFLPTYVWEHRNKMDNEIISETDIGWIIASFSLA